MLAPARESAARPQANFSRIDTFLSSGAGVPAPASSMGAMKRYSRLGTVSMKRGFSAESSRASRILQFFLEFFSRDHLAPAF
jgi:hypothetical protein